MRSNYERRREVDPYNELVLSGVNEFIESKGYFMNLLEHDDKKICFQIWKDIDGLPLTSLEGLENFVQTMKEDCSIIQDDTEVTLSYLAGGIVHITIELDKTK